jgi:hypothetical protein
MFLGQFFVMDAMANNPQKHKMAKLNSIRSINSNSGFVKNTNPANVKVKYYIKSPCFNIYLYENGFSYEFLGMKGRPEQLMPTYTTNRFETWPNKNISQEANQILSNKVDITFENALPSGFEMPFTINSTKKINRISYSSKVEEIVEYKIVRVNNIYKNIDIEYQYSETGFKYNFIIKPGGNINDLKLGVAGANKTSLTGDGFIKIETDLGTIKEFIPLSYYGNDIKKNHAAIHFIAIKKNTFGFKSLSKHQNEILTIDPSPIISYFGDSLADKVTDMVTDDNGNIYLTGIVDTENSVYAGSGGSVIFPANNDVYIAKFDSMNKLQWVTYFGGKQDENLSKICLDLQNNIYILFASNSDSGISTVGSHQPNLKGSHDIVLLKLNSQGQRIWATYSGTSSQEAAGGICCDKFGDIIISLSSGGLSYDTSMTTIGTYPRKYVSGVVQKFNSFGLRLWGAFAGDRVHFGSPITTDELGNIYGTGTTQSDSNIATLGAFQSKRGGYNTSDVDGVVFKLLPNGIMAWSTYFGGNNSDFLYSIACDKNFNVIAAGTTKSDTGISSNGSYQQYFSGGNSGWELDCFMIKLDSTGQRKWATYYGKNGNENIAKIAIDSFSNIYLGGFTSSTDSFATPNAFNSTYNGGGNDGFIAVFNAIGKLKYSTYIGGSEIDEVTTISLRKNIIHFAGITNSNSMFTSNGAYDTLFAGSYDGFFGSIIYNQIDDSITNNTIGNSQLICNGEAIDTLIGSIPLGGNGDYSYKWITSSINDKIGFILASGINSIQNYIPILAAEKRWYRRIVISGNMVDTSNAVSIFISKKLSVGFTVNKQIQCISKNQFIFSDTTNGSNTHFWDFGNGDTSTLPNPIIKYKPRIYNGVIVKLISSIDGNCSDSSFQTIYLINNPQTSVITGDSQVMRLNLSTYTVIPRNGSTYQWYFTKGTGSGNSNLIQIKWRQIGIDTLRLIERTSGGCFGDTIKKIVQINLPSAVTKTDDLDLFQLFPNPSNGLISINYSFTGEIKLQVIDVLGRIVKDLEIHKSQEQFNIDLSALSSGSYFLIIKTSNGESLHKNIQINKD